METEFNLSEKRKPAPFETKWNNDGEPIEHTYRNVYFEEDIKEFIKRVKEKMCVCGLKEYSDTICSNCAEIDKLAGDKLWYQYYYT